MGYIIDLPKEVESDLRELMKAGHPLSMSISSTRYVARKYGFTALADFLEEPGNAGKYITFVMTQKPLSRVLL